MREKIISKALIVLAVFFLPIFITTLLADLGRNTVNNGDTMVTVEYNDGKIQLPLNQYLIGVVAAEMPIQFEEEALKAQAVAARTYTMKRYQKDPQMVFTSTIQSYYSKNELENLWGVDDYPLNYSKIKQAVEGTKNQVLTYQDDLIDAVFHSTSIGVTRSALEVWGQDIPYLQKVESLEDINASTYLHQYALSYDEVKKKANTFDDQIVLTDELSNDIQIIERNKEGYVLKIQVGNKIYSGEEFRKIFGLASSNFSILFNEKKVEVVCRGYGHGVGLSQYGAESMAKAGLTYDQILLHFYTSIELTTIEEAIK